VAGRSRGQVCRPRERASPGFPSELFGGCAEAGCSRQGVTFVRGGRVGSISAPPAHGTARSSTKNCNRQAARPPPLLRNFLETPAAKIPRCPGCVNWLISDLALRSPSSRADLSSFCLIASPTSASVAETRFISWVREGVADKQSFQGNASERGKFHFNPPVRQASAKRRFWPNNRRVCDRPLCWKVHGSP